MALLTLFSSGSLKAQEWELQNEDEGIKVYTAEFEGYGMPAFRAHGLVPKATVESFIQIIKDTENSTDIYPNQDHSVMVKDEGNHFIIHAFSKAIWPLSGRDGYYDYRVEELGKGQTKISINTLTNYGPEEEDYVRLNKGYGHWLLTETSEGLMVEYMFVTDAGGGVPMWLKESVVSSTPIETIVSIRQLF